MIEPATLPAPSARCPGCGATTEATWLVCAWCGGTLLIAHELPIGTRLVDRFVVRRLLGRGGFGITYEVDDERLQRRVALKELFPPGAVRREGNVLPEPRGQADFQVATERFLREARGLARFTHPGIVRVYEVFEAHNTAYLVMERLEGATLAQLLDHRGCPFAAVEVLDVAARVGEALEAIHGAGLLHRDVNPTNVIVTTSGRVVLIDFGLARRYGEDATAALTRMVTPGFAPPEQYSGEGPFGPSTDVYGLAATLYRMLTARTPPSAFERQAGTALPTPASLVPGVPKLLSDGVLDGLELQPAHRPASARAFLDRLGLNGLDAGARSRLADASRAVVAGHATTPIGVSADQTDPQGGRPPTEVSLSSAAPALPTRAATHVAGPAYESGATVVAAGPSVVGASSAFHAAPLGPRPGPDLATSPRARAVPPVVGPHPRGRRWLTFAAGGAALALASSTPVLVTAVLSLVVLPVLATVGDVVAHRHRQSVGLARRAWQRATPGAVVPLHLVRNVLMSAMRSVPAYALGALALLGAHLAGGNASLGFVRSAVLRVGGALVAAMVVIPARADARGFRSGTGLQHVLSGLLTEDGRVGVRGWAVVLTCGAAAAGGLWLRPDIWPLPR